MHHLPAQVGPRVDHEDRVRLLDCVTACATAYLWSRAERRAEDLAVRAMAVARDLGCDPDPAYLRLRHVQGWALREQGGFAEAEEILRDVPVAQTALPGGPDRADTLRTRHDLAWTTGRQGDWARTEQELREVRDRRRARSDSDHDDSDVLHTRCMLCWSVGMQGRWAEAEDGYRAVLVERTALIGADHPDTLLARQLHAYAAGRLSLERDEAVGTRRAIRALRRTRAPLRDVRGPDDPATVHAGSFLATPAGRYSPALPWPGDVPRPR